MGERSTRSCNKIPAETLIHLYNVLIIAYLCIFFSQIGKSAVLIALHLAVAAAYITFQVFRNRYKNPLLQISTVWIPLILLSGLHYETGLFNRIIIRDFLDDFVIYTDQILFGSSPYLILRESFPSEFLAQLSHASYASFYILLVAPITLLYFHERKIASGYKSPREFWIHASRVKEMQFVLTFTMLCCYIIAIILPVKGPTDYHPILFPESRGMVAIMDFLFANGDLDGGAMPSSHVAGALVVVIYAFRYLRPWFWAALGLFVPMTFSTVYNSYHYATDIIAGLIAGWLFYLIGRAIFKAVDSLPPDTECHKMNFRMKPIHFDIPSILRFNLFLLLLIFSLAIVFTTNKNVRIVRTTAIQSLTDTAMVLSSKADDALRSMGEKDPSDISAIFSDRIVAYALIAQKDGTILFHTNPALINTRLPAQEIEKWISSGTFASRRIILGTGVPAYEFNFVMYRPESPEMLRLVLQTTTADKMIRQAERMWWITGLLICLLWTSGIIFERFFTNRIKTQAMRENQRRLTLIGQMTSSLAHEIRNALGSIKGYSQWLEEKAAEGSPQKHALSTVIAGTLRIEALVNELLLYSKDEVYNNEPVELMVLIREAIAASAPGLSNDIELDIPTGASVRADREKLFRVIVNGIRNALDAIGEDGKLRIFAREGGRWVSVYIEDTGGGISGKDHDRLFTPFYTTKTDGTGLGLAYAKKVVEGMGGSIALTNRTGGVGAVLTIQLPKISSSF